MSIELSILKRYNQSANTPNPDLDLLFKIISDFMKEKKWVYDGKEQTQDIWTLSEESKIIVNCFHLAELFVHMATKIGISPEKCSLIELRYFVNNKNNSWVQGSYQSIFSSLPTTKDGLYEFDVHCIAMIDNFCFDLCLQAKYPLINDGVDLYASLMLAMDLDDIDEFTNLVTYLININEQDPITGWTLLHLAISQKKYSFAQILLKNGAIDNIPDNNHLSALDILNLDIYDSSTPLRDLYKAQEYLAFKMDLAIQNKLKHLQTENRAATVIQSFWKNKGSISKSTEPNPLQPTTTH